MSNSTTFSGTFGDFVNLPINTYYYPDSQGILVSGDPYIITFFGIYSNISNYVTTSIEAFLSDWDNGCWVDITRSGIYTENNKRPSLTNLPMIPAGEKSFYFIFEGLSIPQIRVKLVVLNDKNWGKIDYKYKITGSPQKNNEVDDHQGMVYNPISKKWTFGII